jgi:hypothetical protein
MDIAGFLLILGASARLTRLVTRDEILSPLRERAGEGWRGFFLVCPYCVGLWITGLVALLWLWVPEAVFAWGAVVLSANLIWAVTQEVLDTVVELHRERTNALAPPAPAPRARGARMPHIEE